MYSSGLSKRSRRSPRRTVVRRVVALSVLGIVIVAGVAYGAYRALRPHNVSHPNVSFTKPQTTTTQTTTQAPDTFAWPLYGYTLDRTRDFTAGGAKLDPPFKVAWHDGGNALLEFPPSIDAGYLYFMDDSATVKKVRASDGHHLWHNDIGTLSAATPALDIKDQLLFVPTLSDTGKEPGNGRFAALSMKTGKIVWSIPVSSGSESSPLYRDGVVYFGTQAGTVYGVAAKTGKILWSFSAAGDVKGGPAYSDGLLYFGDYAGKVYALHASTGKLAWEAGSGTGAFGYGSGRFYSTAAVAYGRVYVGNTNGAMYSFAAKTGALAWDVSTGAYVYAAPSVADVSGLGPTVYVGSYNGDFYAFNAQSGAIRWVHRDGYQISGSSTIIGNTVYYSDFDHYTTGLNTRTGKSVFRFHDGAYTPMVATPKALYLAGNYTLYELLPKH